MRPKAPPRRPGVRDPRYDEKVLRPTVCPFCKGRRFDPALAKIVTAKTFWRCRDCDQTWTIANVRESPTRVH